MRPRPDAAENIAEAITDQIRLVRASMRPRPDAAENLVPDPAALAAALLQ